MGFARRLLVLSAALIAVSVPSAAIAAPPSGNATASRLVTGLQGGLGSTIGPDGALYVTETAAGRITRVDPQTGATTTYASGLPKPVIGLPTGGAMDIAFLGHTAYVLVTLVGPDVGGSDIDGIYRVDGPHRFTVVADIGQFATGHPPATPFEVPSGVQFALQPYRGGFLVTDGHHNRVYQVTLDGTVTQLIAFGNIVPTGLAVRGNTIYMAEAGPVPHLPENGKVVSFGPTSATATQVAAGRPLLVDVEFGRGRTLYALSQGVGSGGPPGSPALPDTGALVRVNRDGTFTVVTGGLDRPTSLEFIGTTAYVVTLGGEIWKIDGVTGPPYGVSH
jgi:sugar lactone lactonase YvrE